MDLYVDDDGYICFLDGEILWTLHHDGWEAFLPGKDEPCFCTGDVTFPTNKDLREARAIYEEEGE